MKKETFVQVAMVLIISCFFVISAKSQDINHRANALLGNFAGEWTSYKKNLAGDIEMVVTWKDTLRTSDLHINDSMAYVKVSSKSVFDNPSIPEYSLEFTEGFFIEDGVIGDHFFEVLGKKTIQTKLDAHTYVYSQKIEPNEFSQMRFFNVVEGYHTVVKLVLITDGVERHDISRLSTIQWIDTQGKVQNTQFVSLKGFHERID